MFHRPITRVAFAAIVVLAPFWPAVAAATNNTDTTTTTTTSTTVPESTTSTTTTVPETTTSTSIVEETTTTSTVAETTTTTVPAAGTTTVPADTTTTVACDGDRCTPPPSVPECDRDVCPPPAPPGVPQGCQSDRPELCAPSATIPPCPEGMFPSTSAGDLPCLPEDPCTTAGFTVWHVQPCTVEQNQPPTTTTIPPGTRMLPETGREIETMLLIALGLSLAGVLALVVWGCSRQFDEGEWQ